jgi:hypothetical protein
MRCFIRFLADFLQSRYSLGRVFNMWKPPLPPLFAHDGT